MRTITCEQANSCASWRRRPSPTASTSPPSRAVRRLPSTARPRELEEAGLVYLASPRDRAHPFRPRRSCLTAAGVLQPGARGGRHGRAGSCARGPSPPTGATCSWSGWTRSQPSTAWQPPSVARPVTRSASAGTGPRPWTPPCSSRMEPSWASSATGSSPIARPSPSGCGGSTRVPSPARSSCFCRTRCASGTCAGCCGALP